MQPTLLVTFTKNKERLVQAAGNVAAKDAAQLDCRKWSATLLYGQLTFPIRLSDNNGVDQTPPLANQSLSSFTKRRDMIIDNPRAAPYHRFSSPWLKARMINLCSR